MAAAVVVSVLLHAALLTLRVPRPSVALPPAPKAMKIWVRPVARPAPPALVEAPEPPAPVVRPAPREPSPAPPAHRAQPASAPPAVIAVAPSPATTPAPDAFTVRQAPAVDIDRARATARALAHETDPAAAAREYAAIERAKSNSRDARLGRAIEAAHRPLCKDGIPGGLLAPLVLLAQKKDSGCKW